MNPWKKIILLFLLAAVSALCVPAQTKNESSAFNTTGFPQWAKDLRRWEIVAFGSIPFTMFFTTFGMDMYRWYNANGIDLNDRSYAPWPLKGAGAPVFDSGEFETIFKIAACLSMSIAFTDLIIVKIKRYRARKRAEALPAGTTIIHREPWPEETPADNDGNHTDDASIPAKPVPPEQPVPEKP